MSGALDTRAAHAVCITVYNEAPAELAATLDSLRAALAQASHDGWRRADDTLVAIIVDGVDRAHPQLVGWLRAQGLIDAEPDGLDTQDRHWLTRAAPGGVGEPLRTLVWLKGRNRGKLDSHALFFGQLCPAWQPELCFQLDCGTLVDRAAFSAMLAQFQREPETAALAARIGTAAPRPDEGLLAAWQHLDFAMQAALQVPAEVGSGHLSVLPGQFCALRWAALRGRDGTPLAGYLRGTAPRGAWERTMFMAEDRVMGSEIVLHEPTWRLRHCSAAHASTDACATLPELLRQRRRWNNGATACRLWLAARLLGPAGAGAGAALRLGVAWQMLQLLMQALTPAIVICAWVLQGQALVAAWQGGAAGAVLLFGAALATALAAALARQAVLRDVGFALALASMVGMLTRWLPGPALLLLLLPAAVAAAAAAAQVRRPVALLRRLPEFVLLGNPVLQCVCWAYSVARVGDTSWGTKGLTAGRGLRLPGAVLLVGWGGVNALAVALAFNSPPQWFTGLNPLLEGAALYLCASLALAWRAGGSGGSGRIAPGRPLPAAPGGLP
jgi:chitin synthase